MRAEKQLLLDDMVEKISNSKGFVITNYEKLNPDRDRKFRFKLAENNAEFEVVKKRVFIKAAEIAGHKIDFPLEGHVGVLFARDDTLQMLKSALAFGEENDNFLGLLGGVFEGQLCGSEEISAIAKLPALPELRAQFLGLLEAPMGQMVGVVQSILSSILYCIENRSKQEEG